MSDINYELELFKIVTEDKYIVDEFGWVSDTEFYIWVSYYNLYDFMEKIKNVFGHGLFDDGSFNSNMRPDCVCIDLCEMLGCHLEVEDIFPKDKYQH